MFGLDYIIRTIVDPSQAVSGSRIVRRHLQDIEKTANLATNTSRTLNRVLSAIGLSLAAGQVIEYADAWTLSASRLRQVIDNTVLLRQVQDELFDSSQKTFRSYQSSADLFFRIARHTKNLSLTMRELLDVTNSINQAIVLSGSTMESATAALVQFGQGLASDRLSGDEFRSVSEQLPRLAEAIADGMGVTIAQLRIMGREGELTAGQVIKAIKSQQEAIKKEFEAWVPTIAQSIQLLDNAFTVLIGKFFEYTGVNLIVGAAFKQLSMAITDVSNNMELFLRTKVQPYIRMTTDWIMANETVTATIVALSAASVAATASVGALNVAVGILTKIFKGTGAALFRIAANPLTMLAALGSALVGVIYYFRDFRIEVGDEVFRVKEVVQYTFEGIAQIIRDWVGVARANFIAFQIEVKTWFEKIMGVKMDTFFTFLKIEFVNDLKDMGAAIKGFLNWVFAFINSMNVIKYEFFFIWESMVDVIDYFFSYLEHKFKEATLYAALEAAPLLGLLGWGAEWQKKAEEEGKLAAEAYSKAVETYRKSTEESSTRILEKITKNFQKDYVEEIFIKPGLETWEDIKKRASELYKINSLQEAIARDFIKSRVDLNEHYAKGAGDEPDNLSATIDRARNSFESLLDKIDKAGAAYRDFIKNQNTLNDAFKAGIIHTEELAEYYEKLQSYTIQQFVFDVDPVSKEFDDVLTKMQSVQKLAGDIIPEYDLRGQEMLRALEGVDQAIIDEVNRTGSITIDLADLISASIWEAFVFDVDTALNPLKKIEREYEDLLRKIEFIRDETGDEAKYNEQIAALDQVYEYRLAPQKEIIDLLKKEKTLLDSMVGTRNIYIEFQVQEDLDSLINQGVNRNFLDEDYENYLRDTRYEIEYRNEVLQAQQVILDNIVEPQRQYNIGLQAAAELLSLNYINVQQYNDALDTLRYTMLSSRKDMDAGFQRGFLSLKMELSDMASVAENAVVNSFKSMEDAIVNFVTTGKFSIKDLAATIAAEFTRLAVRGITSQLFGNLLGLGTSVAGGFAGGFSAPNTAGADAGFAEIGGYFSDINLSGPKFSSPLPATFRAEGGPVYSNKPYIVGEKGPELFIPKVPGVVIPHELTELMMKKMNPVSNKYDTVYNVQNPITNTMDPVSNKYDIVYNTQNPITNTINNVYKRDLNNTQESIMNSTDSINNVVNQYRNYNEERINNFMNTNSNQNYMEYTTRNTNNSNVNNTNNSNKNIILERGSIVVQMNSSPNRQRSRKAGHQIHAELLRKMNEQGLRDL